MTPAARRRAANGLLDALRRGHDVPAADVDDALAITGDLPQVSDDEAAPYNALRCRDSLGGIHHEETEACHRN